MNERKLSEDFLLLKLSNLMKELLEEFQRFKFSRKLENLFMKW